jgi:adenosylcobinamide-phosphate synthase
VVLIVGLTGLAGVGIEWGIALLSTHVPAILGMALMVYFVATTIATRELMGSVRRVVESVAAGDLAGARRDLGMMWGANTEDLSRSGRHEGGHGDPRGEPFRRVIAPIFYFVLEDSLWPRLPGVNTLDPWWGYKNDLYIRFGWGAPRLDDAANYIPRGFTGVLIVTAAFVTGAFTKGLDPVSRTARSLRVLRRDGRNHTSPNSGMPEAAMAGALGVRMGGPSRYGGRLVEKPYIGEQERADHVAASAEAIRIGYVVALLGVLAAALALSLRSVAR